VSDDLGWELMTGKGDGLHVPILPPPVAIRVTKPSNQFAQPHRRTPGPSTFIESSRLNFMRAQYNGDTSVLPSPLCTGPSGPAGSENAAGGAFFSSIIRVSTYEEVCHGRSVDRAA
jgi:hypothetical protein